MTGARFGATKLPMVLGAAAMALTLLALLAVTPSLKTDKPSELIGGMDFAGGIPPEGVLDDMMDNVDPTDPYGGPVWGLHSGDIGMGEYKARPQQLWDFGMGMQHQEMEPLAVGAGQNGPPPSYEATLPEQKAKQQQLWGFNMQYEHHEQPPIFFGPGARSEQPVQMEQLPAARTMSLASPSEKAKQQQLWGFNMQYEHHEQPPIFFGPGARSEQPVQMEQLPAARTMSLASPSAASAEKAKQQKLWGFNMQYEHHEQPPIFFGPGARNNQDSKMAAQLKQQAARQMQLWGWNMGYDHHEQQPPSMWPAKATAPVQAKGRQQQLWGWSMGYEHHEQHPPSMWDARARTNMPKTV